MSAACGFPIGPEFHRYLLMNSMHPVPFFRNLPSQYNNFYLTAKGAAVPPPQNGRWSQYSLVWRLLPPSWPLLTFTPVFPVGSNIKFSCQRDQAGPPLCLFGISGDSLPLGSLGRSVGRAPFVLVSADRVQTAMLSLLLPWCVLLPTAETNIDPLRGQLLPH